MKELYYIKKVGWEYDELPTYYSVSGEWTREWCKVKVFESLDEAINCIDEVVDEHHLITLERF